MRRIWSTSLNHADPIAAALLTGLAAAFLAAAGQIGSLPGSPCVLGFCVTIAVRQRWPIAASMAAGVLIGVPQFAHDAFTANDNGTFLAAWVVIFLFAYTLGSAAPFPLSLLGLATILVGVNLSAGGFNPVPEMVALGPYAGGLAVASRRRVSGQLELRARELEEEQEVFAQESVRYERARIARELHDIVAHSVSLMVVQASAGERLASRDPDRAAEAFTNISEAAHQAELEIARLVEFLGDSPPASPSAGLRIVEELVARARASGLSISCTMRGDIDNISHVGADAAYRVVQEAITNAMKHAPGASIEIAVEGQSLGVDVRVHNGPPIDTGAGLEHSGGGHGLRGLRARVIECGGQFSAGSTPDGGWSIAATLPRRGTPWNHIEMTDAPHDISVLIVDDQRLVRAGFSVILGTEAGITVVGEAGDGMEALALTHQLSPDVVLMDIRMPNMDGLAAARIILSETASRVLMLTTFDTDEYVYAALRAGASGFLLKDAPSEQLVSAVRIVASGDALIDPAITRRLITQFADAARPAPSSPPQLESLTPRERDVLQLVAQGCSNAEIATSLVVEESTVKTHVGRILMKLNLRDRVQAVVLAYETGFVVPDVT